MMTYADQSAQQLEMDQRRVEEELKRQKEEQERRAFMLAQQQQQQQQQSSPAMGGINPMSMMSSSSAGGGSAAGGSVAGGGAAGGGAAGGASGGSAASSGIASFWPAAVFVAAAAQHNWARKKGIHDNKDALTGKALQKDTAYYQPRLNEKLDGLGDEVRLAGLGSSPADLFKADTWKEAAKLAARGGILGKALKKIF